MAYKFYDDEDFNFRAQITLGGVAVGLGDVGEILGCLTRIPAGDNNAWANEFLALADRVKAIAGGCAKAGFRQRAAGHGHVFFSLSLLKGPSEGAGPARRAGRRPGN